MLSNPKTWDVVIVGNGILATTTARELMLRDSSLRILCIGPRSRSGSATKAAAAMLNSIAEVDSDTLDFPILRARLALNRLANRSTWTEFLRLLEDESGRSISYGFGTYVINNSKAGLLEDRNYDAILRALETFNEEYRFCTPNMIPKYKPQSNVRALRSLFLPNEGWVNPVQTLDALEISLSRYTNFELLDDCVESIVYRDNEVRGVKVRTGGTVSANCVLLANGAAMSDVLVASGLEELCLRVFYGVGVTALLRSESDTLTNCIRTPNRGLACGLYSAPQSPTETIVGATNAIWDSPRFEPTLSNVHTLLSNARTELSLNLDRSSIVRFNVGWRPITEDLMPLIGASPIQGLYIWNGMRRDGFHCAPVLSGLLSQVILGGVMPDEFKPFAVRTKPLKIYTRDESIERIVDHSLCGAFEHGLDLGGLEPDLLERSFLRLATEVHDRLNLNSIGIHPEFFSYYRRLLQVA